MNGKTSGPKPPVLTVRLTYIISLDARPTLESVERYGIGVKESDSYSAGEDFPENLSGFVGLQLLLLLTYIARHRSDRACPKLQGPRAYLAALHSASRNKSAMKWRDAFFVINPKDIYLTAHYNPEAVSATTSLKVEIYLRPDYSDISVPAQIPDVEKLRDALIRRDYRDLDLQVNVEDKVRFEEWTITGQILDRSVCVGCLVQMEVKYKWSKPLVIWISDDRPYQIMPNIDPSLAKEFTKATSPGENHYNVKLPSFPGFPVVSKSGINCCLVVGTVRNEYDPGKLWPLFETFFKQNPLSSFSHDLSPTKRYFRGSSTYKTNLGPIPVGTSWNRNTFDAILPEQCCAVLMTLPIRNVQR